MYKYQEYLDSYENCPPVVYAVAEKMAYRFVHDETNENNFKPVLKISPDRINDRMFDLETAKCKGYALSMYITHTQGKAAYSKRMERTPTFYQTVGSYLAEGLIEAGDGVCGVANNIGHFEFHEFEDCNLQPKFTIVETLYIP